MSSIAPNGTGMPETVATKFVELGRIQQRMHNDMQTINKLPVELLSRIFTIGEASDRNTRPRTKWYIGFQEIVTHVCHRWREVAIRCPTLWVYIHITRPSPYHLVSLYLDRAGPGSLLDIDIEMRTRFWKAVAIEAHDWETQLHKVPYLLKFLVSRGATIDRWRSLTVCAKQPELLYAIIGFVNARPARALQFVSCKWKYWRRDPEIDSDEELRGLEYPHLFSESYSFSPSMMPKLRSIAFDAVSWAYVFDRYPGPSLLTGLTSLSLTSAHLPCSIYDLQNLLASNPDLEHLSLDISKKAASVFSRDNGPLLNPVCLSKLRSLSFGTSGDTEWVVAALPVIEAPVLRRLSIAGDFILWQDSFDLATHITGGILQHDRSGGVSSTRDIRPTHPLLDELDISMLTMVTEILLRMLSSLPTITKLHISNRHIKQLKPMPQILPNLEHIYCSWVSYGHLGDLLEGRANIGSPIRVVHLNYAGLDEVGGLLPENAEYLEYHRQLGHEFDYDQSDVATSDDGLGEDEDMFEDSSDDLMLMMDEVRGSSDEDDSSLSAQEPNQITMDN